MALQMQTYIRSAPDTANELANKNDSQYDCASPTPKMQAHPMMPSTPSPPPTASDAAARPGGEAGTRVVDSTALFGGGQEVVIRHNGRDYRLRRTRLGKLILTA